MKTLVKYLYKLSLRQIERKKPLAARRLLSVAILFKNDQPNLYLGRAKANMQLRAFKKVKEDIKMATLYGGMNELVPPKISRILGEQLAALEEIGSASLKKITAPDATLALHKLKTAKSLEAEGDIIRALRMYDSAVRNLPENETIRYERAKAYLNAGRYSSAMKDFSWIICHNPECWEAYIGRGYLKFNQGNIPEAIADFTIARTGDPTNYEAAFNLAYAILEAGKKPEDALTQFDGALKIKPDSNDALIGRGRAYLQMAMLEPAVADFERVRESEKSSGRAWFWIGEAAAKKNDRVAAIEAFTKSIELGSDEASEALKKIHVPEPIEIQNVGRRKEAARLKKPRSTDDEKVSQYLEQVLATGDVKIPQGMLEELTGLDQSVWSKLMHKPSFWEALDKKKAEKHAELKKQLVLLTNWDIMADKRRTKLEEDRPYQERSADPEIMTRTNIPQRKKHRSNDEEYDPEGILDDEDLSDWRSGVEEEGVSSELIEEGVEKKYELEMLLESLSDNELRREIQILNSDFKMDRLKSMSREELIQFYLSLH